MSCRGCGSRPRQACGVCQQEVRRLYHYGAKKVIVPQGTLDATGGAGVRQLILKDCVFDSLDYSPGLVCTVGYTIVGGEGQFADMSQSFMVAEFGSGAPDLQTMEFDLGTGRAVPLIGGGGRPVNLYIVHPSIPFQGAELVPTIEVSVSVGVCGYGSADVRAARRTKILGTIVANANSLLVPIPRYAVSAVFTSADAPTTAMTLLQRIAPVAASAIVSTATLSKIDGQAIPIANGARAFQLTNPNNADATNVAVVFALGPA